MRRVRRTSPEVRLELTPLIDVVFLLLTFFIFAMLVMVRANVLDVDLPELGSGEDPASARVVTLALRADGGLFLDGEAVDVAAAPDLARARLGEAGENARLVLAVDEGGRSGDLLELADVLAGAGLTDFSILGRPVEAIERIAPPSMPAPAPTSGG